MPYIYDYLSKRGWTKEAIAGLFGNIYRESGFNPGAWGSYNKNPTSHSIGYGIAQFTPANNFLSWADLTVEEAEAMAIVNPQKLMDLQLEYIIAASTTNNYDERAWYPSIAKAKHTYSPYYMTFSEFIAADSSYDVGGLALVFESHFERSSAGDKYDPNTKELTEGLRLRKEAAYNWYEFLKKNRP